MSEPSSGSALSLVLEGQRCGAEGSPQSPSLLCLFLLVSHQPNPTGSQRPGDVTDAAGRDEQRGV